MPLKQPGSYCRAVKEWEKSLALLAYYLLAKEILKVYLEWNSKMKLELYSSCYNSSPGWSEGVLFFPLFLLVSHNHLGILMCANYPLSVCLNNLQCKGLKGLSRWQV